MILRKLILRNILTTAALTIAVIVSFFMLQHREKRNNELVISAQTIDDHIRVTRIFLQKPGYVVVTGIRYDRGIGVDYLASSYLSAGEHINVDIPFTARLYPDKSDTYQPVEPVQPEGYLIGALFERRGGEQDARRNPHYTPGIDTPAVNASGEPVIVRFSATLLRDPYAIKRTCTETGNSRNIRACFDSSFSDFAANPGFMIDVCQIVSVADKEECYQSMGMVLLATHVPIAKREEICSHTGLADYIRWCLNK